MAFSHALLNKEKAPEACPHLLPENAELLKPMLEASAPVEGYRENIEALRAKVADLDLGAMAEALGGRYDSGRLYITCLGRDFIVLDNGQLESICHVNVWVELMLLNYVNMQGLGSISGRWISYGELKNAGHTAPYFERRCQEPLRAIADSHTDVFIDLMEIFGGSEVEGFESDHAFVIHPLPKVPFLVLYTRPEEDQESRLKILLDSSVLTYIPIETITYIGRGIVEMFKKIVSKHQDTTEDLMFM